MITEEKITLGEANKWATEKGTIYVSDEDRRIADAGVANEIADQVNLHRGTDLEDIGKKAAQEIEDRRALEARKLNDVQEGRQEWITKELMTKYPGALTEVVVDGQQFWVVKEGQYKKNIIFLTVDGVYDIDTSKVSKPEVISLKKAVARWAELLKLGHREEGGVKYFNFYLGDAARDGLGEQASREIISMREIYPDDSERDASELSRILLAAKEEAEKERLGKELKASKHFRSMV